MYTLSRAVAVVAAVAVLAPAALGSLCDSREVFDLATTTVSETDQFFTEYSLATTPTGEVLVAAFENDKLALHYSADSQKYAAIPLPAIPTDTPIGPIPDSSDSYYYLLEEDDDVVDGVVPCDLPTVSLGWTPQVDADLPGMYRLVTTYRCETYISLAPSGGPITVWETSKVQGENVTHALPSVTGSTTSPAMKTLATLPNGKCNVPAGVVADPGNHQVLETILDVSDGAIHGASLALTWLTGNITFPIPTVDTVEIPLPSGVTHATQAAITGITSSALQCRYIAYAGSSSSFGDALLYSVPCLDSQDAPVDTVAVTTVAQSVTGVSVATDSADRVAVAWGPNLQIAISPRNGTVFNSPHVMARNTNDPVASSAEGFFAVGAEDKATSWDVYSHKQGGFIGVWTNPGGLFGRSMEMGENDPSRVNPATVSVLVTLVDGLTGSVDVAALPDNKWAMMFSPAVHSAGPVSVATRSLQACNLDIYNCGGVSWPGVGYLANACCDYQGQYQTQSDTCVCDDGEHCGLMCAAVTNRCNICGVSDDECCSGHGRRAFQNAHCVCDDGFCGADCNSPLDDCCVPNHGTWNANSAFCECAHDTRWCGDSCSQTADYCGVCMGDGRSCCGEVGVRSDSGCVCDDSSLCGEGCNQKVDACGNCNGDSRSCCSDNGVFDSKSKTCKCDEGFVGDDCQPPVSPLDPSSHPAAFAAVVGSSVAAVGIIGFVGYRKMKKRQAPGDVPLLNFNERSDDESDSGAEGVW